MKIRRRLLIACSIALVGVVVVSTSSGAGGLPPPSFGRSVDIGLVSGVVMVRPVKGISFQLGSRDRNIPVGSEIDTRRGEVDLRSARATPSATVQDGQFNGGLFKILQRRSQRGLTELDLTMSTNVRRACTVTPNSEAASRRLSSRVLTTLHARVHGKFSTRGRYSAGTVRGTKWDTVERCDGTLTRVYRGVVAVRDFRRHKTILVPAGHSYLARAL
jgi:hypothetical protein